MAGALFDLFPAIVYSQIGPLVGAYAVFIATRWGGLDTARKLADRYPQVRRITEGNPGFWSVFVLRQMPIPGLAVSVLMGLSPVDQRAFLLGSLVGFLPEGVVAAMLGGGLIEQSLAQSVSQVAAAVAILAVFYWVIRRLGLSRLGAPPDIV